MALYINPPDRSSGSVSVVKLPEVWKTVREEGLRHIEALRPQIARKHRASQRIIRQQEENAQAIKDSLRTNYKLDVLDNQRVAKAVLKNLDIKKENIKAKGEAEKRKWEALGQISAEAGKIAAAFDDVIKQKADVTAKTIHAKARALQISLSDDSPLKKDFFGKILSDGFDYANTIDRAKELNLSNKDITLIERIHRSKGLVRQKLQNLRGINIAENINVHLAQLGEAKFNMGDGEERTINSVLGIADSSSGDLKSAARAALQEEIYKFVGNDQAFFDHVLPAFNEHFGGIDKKVEREEAQRILSEANNERYNAFNASHKEHNKDGGNSFTWLLGANGVANRLKREGQTTAEHLDEISKVLAWKAGTGDQRAIDLSTELINTNFYLNGEDPTKIKPGTDVTFGNRKKHLGLILKAGIDKGNKIIVEEQTQATKVRKAVLERKKTRSLQVLGQTKPEDIDTVWRQMISKAKGQHKAWLVALSPTDRGHEDKIEIPKFKARLEQNPNDFPARHEIMKLPISTEGIVELTNYYDSWRGSSSKTAVRRADYATIKGRLAQLVNHSTGLVGSKSPNFDSEFEHAKHRYHLAYQNSGEETAAGKHKEAMERFELDLKNGYHAVNDLPSGSDAGSFKQNWQPKTAFSHRQGYKADKTYYTKNEVMSVEDLNKLELDPDQFFGYIPTRDIDKYTKGGPTFTELVEQQAQLHGIPLPGTLEILKDVESYIPSSDYLKAVPGLYSAFSPEDQEAFQLEFQHGSGEIWSQESTIASPLLNKLQELQETGGVTYGR